MNIISVLGTSLRNIKWLCVFAFVAAMASPSAQALSPVNKTYFGSKAISGYDPVAYFTDQKPVKGDSKYSLEWKGATWLFANEKNLEAFQHAPEKYAPQYGGYCAWAVSQGDTADIDPQCWSIIDGRLFLNYSKAIQAKWLQDATNLIRKSDANWPKLVGE